MTGTLLAVIHEQILIDNWVLNSTFESPSGPLPPSSLGLLYPPSSLLSVKTPTIPSSISRFNAQDPSVNTGDATVTATLAWSLEQWRQASWKDNTSRATWNKTTEYVMQLKHQNRKTQPSLFWAKTKQFAYNNSKLLFFS